jgi:hypothetical protein
MKPKAAGLLKVLVRGTPGLIKACCVLLLSRPTLAQPWTAAKKSSVRIPPERS